MSYFVFGFNRRIYFGAGLIKVLGKILKEEFGSCSAMIVYDSIVKANGCLESISCSLKEYGIESDCYEAKEAEPSNITVEECAVFLRARKFDIIIAVGGGSCIDMVKAARILLNNEGPITAFAGANKVVNPPLVPLIAIATTAGSGSENTSWSVISYPEKQTKFAIGSPHLASIMNFYDPELTLSIPAFITASTGMDAYSHALESYVSILANPITQALSGKAISLITEALPKAVADGNDITARRDMLMGSCLAMMAGEYTNWGLCHAFASPIGGRYKIPHRVIIGILQPYVMEYNMEYSLGLHKEIAGLMGKDIRGLSDRKAAQTAVDMVKDIAEKIKVPTRLSEAGVTKDGLSEVAKICSGSFHLKTNPAPINEEQLLELLYKAY